jgi:hypothetical protein
MKGFRYYVFAIVAVLAGLAVAAPAQAAPPLKRGVSDFGLEYEYSLSPKPSSTADERIFVDRTDNVSSPSTGSVAAGTSEGSVDTAFSWQDAGIGAGAALLLVGALGLVVVVGMRHSRRSVALP